MIIDLNKLKKGTKFRTSKGFVFELVKRTSKGEYWKDVKTKLTWGPEEPVVYDHNQANIKFGGKLPTIAQFKEAEFHGFREITKDNDGWFWSSSVHPDNADNFYYFNGLNGYVNVNHRNNEIQVRCVSGGV